MISNMIAVTQRTYFMNQFGLSESMWMPAFLEQIRLISSLRPKMILLREKDLPLGDYQSLAQKVREICRKENCPFGVHYYPEALDPENDSYLHLPLWKLQDLYNSNKLPTHITYGTSVHSVEDALLASQLGASLLFAGNVFPTECKKGLPGRGLDYLRDVSSAVSIPIYGIGGISLSNMPQILDTGAAGGCMMSGFMSLSVSDLPSDI